MNNTNLLAFFSYEICILRWIGKRGLQLPRNPSYSASEEGDFLRTRKRAKGEFSFEGRDQFIEKGGKWKRKRTKESLKIGKDRRSVTGQRRRK